MTFDSPTPIDSTSVDGENHSTPISSLAGPQRKTKDTIIIDYSRNDNITEFGLQSFKTSYLLEGETPQDLYARVASWMGSNKAHAQRLYDYMSRQWFSPATPILANAGTKRGLPISCYLQSVSDSMEGIIDRWYEQAHLASKGGGIGTYWGRVRSRSERVGQVGTTSGIIPFLKVQESVTLAISQGSLRRGNAAAYLPIWHPEIEEFVDIRKPQGGDPERKTIHLHQGIVIDDKFMQAVESNSMYDLLSPKTGKPLKQIKARDLWIRILSNRVETGEPYLLFSDRMREATPIHHRYFNLYPETSNLCVSGDTKVRVRINSIVSIITIEELNTIFFNAEADDKIEVWSRNLKTGNNEFRLVTDSAQTSKKAKVMKITDDVTGKYVICTPDHKIYTKNRGYVKAKDLQESDEVVYDE